MTDTVFFLQGDDPRALPYIHYYYQDNERPESYEWLSAHAKGGYWIDVIDQEIELPEDIIEEIAEDCRKSRDMEPFYSLCVVRFVFELADDAILFKMTWL